MSDINSPKSVPPQPILKTERLLLRPFVMDDATAIRSIVNNEAVASTMRSMVLPYTEEMARQWLQSQEAIWKTQASAVYGICWNPPETSAEGSPDQSSPLLIGGIGLEICRDDDKGEIGFWIDQSHWGKGVATEAAAALMKFGFEKLRLHKIVAFHMVRNPASGRVMEKLGMQKEGVFRDHVKKSGKFEDSVAYGILASDF